MSLTIKYNQREMLVEVAPDKGLTTLTYKALSKLASINPLKLEACEFENTPCFMLRNVYVGDKLFTCFYFYISDDPTFKSYIGMDVTSNMTHEDYVNLWVTAVSGGKAL